MSIRLIRVWIPGGTLLCVMFLLTAGVWAQSATGTIMGTVTDSTAAVLPGVTVVVKNQESGATRELLTTSEGAFRAPNLPPGPYSVSASMQGFASVERTGIRLTVGREAIVDIALRVGDLTEVITVSGEASVIDTRTASTGGLISEEQIQNLPLNGRSFIELATLVPGVQLTTGGNRGTSTGFGQKISVHGSRYSQNLFTLDGTMMNDQFNQAGSATGNMLGVEAVREFQVLTNSFSAEYGRHTGGVVNAATKSGTNSLSGSVFEFHRNETLDANRWEAERNNLPKPDFTRNQFGVAVGGPVVRNRTFFFANYEGLRENLGQTRTFTVPSLAVRAAAASIVEPFLESYPAPNSDALDARRALYVRQDQRETDEEYLMARVDHRFSPNHTVFGRYTFNDGSVTDPSRITTGAITKTRLQFGTFEYQAVRGTGLVNRLQAGYTDSRLDGYDYVLEGIAMPRLTFTDLDRGIGAISIAGLSAWGGSTTNPKFHDYSNIQISDNVSWVKQAHNIRLGAQIEIQRYDLTSDNTSFGSYDFASINSFLSGQARTFTAVQPGSDTTRRLRQYVFGFYIQDDWSVRSDLTLNLGLRYEPTSDITEVDGKLAQLIDFTNSAATVADTTIVEKVMVNPSLKKLAPRLGFAWDVGGRGRTAVRGGAGIFYDLITANTNFVQNTAVRVPPFFVRSQLRGSAAEPIDFPEAYFTQADRLATVTNLEGLEWEPEQPTVVKWNLNVQRELLTGTAVELGYTGSHGFNLFRHYYTNGREAVEVDGRLVVPPGTPLRQPAFGQMSFRSSDSESWYKGLTVALNRRGAALQTQVSYTLSKSEDLGAQAIGPLDYTNEGGARYLWVRDLDKGPSPFDVRHAFVASVNWHVPFGREGQGFGSALVRNWSLGALARLTSGSPFSVTTGGLERSGQRFSTDYPDVCPGADPNPVLGGPDRYFDPTAFCLQPPGVIGNAPRNSLTGPGSATVDLMLSRSLTLRGSQQLQVRVEMFNVLNRANFAGPNASIFNPDGTYRADAGRITRTVGTPRQMQLGLKFVW